MMRILFGLIFLCASTAAQADLGHAHEWIEQQQKEHGFPWSLHSFPLYQDILRKTQQENVSETDLLDLLGPYAKETSF